MTALADRVERIDRADRADQLPRLPVPSGPAATSPIEASGAPRDSARMLVASPHGLVDSRLRDLPRYLRPGDVLVVNTSAVVPAALPARGPRGAQLRIHLSTPLPGGWWLVEPRRPNGAASLPHPDVSDGDVLQLPDGGSVRLLAPHAPAPDLPPRLWLAMLDLPDLPLGEPTGADADRALHRYLQRHGMPIRYGDPDADWPLATYQTVFADEPGSVESPSAGRGFTGALLARLISTGVVVVGLTLHCGVSSTEAPERPGPERYRVPAATARTINARRSAGGRVVAVGTTVVRALETVADADGDVHPGSGWTEHLVRPGQHLRAVDALLTGWHEPDASHLDMLRAVASDPLLIASYETAAAAGYRWHELGDVHLVLP